MQLARKSLFPHLNVVTSAGWSAEEIATVYQVLAFYARQLQSHRLWWCFSRCQAGHHLCLAS